MKARVIETGEIVDLQTNHMDEFFTKDGVRFIGVELDFDYQPDYWEKLKHQAAIAAMQGLLSNSSITEQKLTTRKGIIEDAERLATALVNRLKEEEKCKE